MKVILLFVAAVMVGFQKIAAPNIIFPKIKAVMKKTLNMSKHL